MSQSTNTKENKKHIKQTYGWIAKVIDMINVDGETVVYEDHNSHLEAELMLPSLNEKGLPIVMPEYAVQTSMGSLTWLPRDDASMIMRLSLVLESKTIRTPLRHFVAIPVYIKSHWRERHRVDTAKCTSHLKNFWDEDAKTCRVHSASPLDKVRNFVPGSRIHYNPGEFGELLNDMGRACFPFVAPMCIHSAASEHAVVEKLHRERPYCATEKGSISAPGAVAGHIMIDDYHELMAVMGRLSVGLCKRYEWFREEGRRTLDMLPNLDDRQVAFERRMRSTGVM